MTQTIFRVWCGECHPGERVFALFPYEPADNYGHLVTSYAHVGQHGGADYGHCISQSRPATPDEYADLKTELESIGYQLEVRQRRQRRAAT